MSESSAFDPYRSPSLPEVPYAGKQTAGRPGWLTALCVICIVLGALGLMNSLFGAVGAAAGPALQTMFQPKGGTPGFPAEMEQAQQDLQADMLDVQKKHLVPIILALVFRFVAATLLLAGGLWCLGLREMGRKLLIVGCAVALLFEIGHTILQSFVMMDTMTAVNSFAEKMGASMQQGNNAPNIGGFMKWYMSAIMVVQIVVMYGLSLLKAALFTFGLIYLQRTHIKALFK